MAVIYKNALLYTLVMRVLYHRHFQARYQEVANLIPAGSSVVDVCAGDCYLYRKYLRARSVQYTGLDISPQFVQSARSQGINACLFNARTDELPPADVIVMMGSIYQFLPHADVMLRKLIAAAHQRVIVAEPIQNLSSSKNPLIATLARILTRAHDKDQNSGRFNQENLQALFQTQETFERSLLIPGGREMIGVFNARK